MIQKEHALELVARPAVPAPRVSQNHRGLAEGWAKDLEAKVAAGLLGERSAALYLRNIQKWLDWLDAAGLSLPTPAHVMVFVGDLRKQGLKPASVNSYLDAVRGLYRWAETENAYPSIGRSVRGVPVRKDAPLDCLTLDQVAALLDHVDGDKLGALRDRAAVHVLACTAMRLVSICAADVGDLDLLDAVLTYTGKGSRGEKTGRAYLSTSALEACRRYLAARRRAEGDLAATAPLFAAVGNRAGGARLSSVSIRRIVVDMMEKAGHVRRGADGHIERPRVFSCHSLRRSAITAAYDARGLDAAQILAGHADPKTTLRAYARVQKGKTLRDLSDVLDLDRVKLERTAT